ncbi:hypothetical protein CENSYa_1173 [Cenarchaeum symbiosum A]|uniref:Uncharacterized protein n=1 Tax=Cenarchaeum symbiosum (strain A) TaxID=414004 RepID=O74042_CENSY|nr:unknown [Cenarchaeum symbiosum]ABK77798.1 hypothetical protein CENSYa_1173 [Cenarchaeum symbiosum A]
MSKTEASPGGYACTPYTHDHASIELKEEWSSSRNVGEMYFVTATFSSKSKPYFEQQASHYLLARFKNGPKMIKAVEGRGGGPSYLFSMDEEIFERESPGMSYVSMYYLEYGDSEEDIREVASVVARKEKIGRAGIGRMDVCSRIPPKFAFPYSGNIVVLEVSSEKSHQSVNKYCEKTRREVIRKGITMTNLVSLSILERLK